MTTTNQAITAETFPQYTLSGVTVADVGAVKPLLLSRYSNRVYGLRLSDNTLMYSDDEMSNWTATTFASSGLQQVIETYDGELLALSGAGQQLNPNYIYRSSGWSTGPTTATFSLKLTITAGVASLWGFGLNSIGPNGTVVVTSYGAQTVSGGQATNTQTGHYSFISTDHGNTFSSMLDLLSLPGNAVQNPAGVHWHGNSYSPLDNCVWLTYGDNTSVEGRGIPGTGNTQLMRYDLDTQTITFLPIGADYSGLTGGNLQQWTGVKVTDDGSVVLTPDAAPYGFYVYPRTGYRTYGSLHAMVVPAPESSSQIGGPIMRAKPGNPYFTASELDGNNPPTSAASLATLLWATIYASVDGLAWQRIWIDTVRPLQANTFYAIIPIGVLASGKFVATYSYRNGGAWPNGALVTGTLVLN